MRLPVILSIFLLLSVAAEAKVYQWVDSQGVMHLTDDLHKVPATYRKKMKVLDESVERGGISSPALKESSAPVGRERKEELYGGHDQGWWRGQFSGLRREKKRIEDTLPAKQDELSKLHHDWVISMGRSPKAGENLSDVNNYTTHSALSTPGKHREAYYNQKAEIEKDEARIKEIEEQLKALDAEATRAGVPFEWRK